MMYYKVESRSEISGRLLLFRENGVEIKYLLVMY